LFKNIFKSDPKESSLAGELRVALLDRDAEKVGRFFTSQFSRVSYHQRPHDEGTFHSLVQVMFFATEFDVQSEVPGATGRLDLILKLPHDVYVIMELKYIAGKKNLTENETNTVLANLAKTELEPDVRDKLLAGAVVEIVGDADHRLSGILGAGLTLSEQNQKLAEEAKRLLPEATIDQALAEEVKEAVSQKKIERALKMALDKSTPSEEILNSDLLKAAQKAINSINNRKYVNILCGVSK
jgi:biotin-(acetyl-CoA carboxylase) ligase